MDNKPTGVTDKKPSSIRGAVCTGPDIKVIELSAYDKLKAECIKAWQEQQEIIIATNIENAGSHLDLLHLKAENEELKVHADKLAAALTFYSSPATYESKIIEQIKVHDSYAWISEWPIKEDSGFIATTALKAYKEFKGEP